MKINEEVVDNEVEGEGRPCLTDIYLSRLPVRSSRHSLNAGFRSPQLKKTGPKKNLGHRNPQGSDQSWNMLRMIHHDSPLAACRSMDIMPNNAAGPVADIPGGVAKLREPNPKIPSPQPHFKAPQTLNPLYSSRFDIVN